MDTRQSRSRESFSKMDATLFALTLEVVLLQLRIHEGSSDLRLSCEWVEKAGKHEQQQYAKLLRDRELVKRVLTQTLIDLADNSHWSPLQQAVRAFEQKDVSIDRRNEYEQLLESQEKICHELTMKHIQWKSDLEKADMRIAELRDKMQDDILNATTRLRYAETWLGARAEAMELRFQKQIARPPPPRKDHEVRVHLELCKFYDLQIKEREKGCEYWEGRYKEDIVCINARLTEKRQLLAINIAKRTELQALYDLHDGEMRAWLDFKAQRAARLAREERNRKAATTIQAWWRGVMVRRAIGPYKYLKNLKPSKSSKSKKK